MDGASTKVEDDCFRIRVDKRANRIRFEGETEDAVTIVIEHKDATPTNPLPQATSKYAWGSNGRE